VIRVSGKDAAEMFKNEAGGHRWQGLSSGRVHTSTITVAVLREPTPTELVLHERDLEYKCTRGSGAGGQSRNTTDSAVVLKYLPTGLTVRCENERSQHMNKATALSVLRVRLLEQQESASSGAYNKERQDQVLGGYRGQKRRTCQEQNGLVVDHVTGRRTTLKNYLKGDLDWLTD
jgi:peptide chain release factor 1